MMLSGGHASLSKGREAVLVSGQKTKVSRYQGDGSRGECRRDGHAQLNTGRRKRHPAIMYKRDGLADKQTTQAGAG